MIEKKDVSGAGISLWCLTLSNFLASFGGGTILGKTLGVLKNEPLLQGDSLLALLCSGIFVVFITPKIAGKRISEAFSVGASILSLVMYSVLQLSADSTYLLTGPLAWFFFLLLCLRFAFYFVARAQRAERSTGQRQAISWVELSFYSGTILGLAVWQNHAWHVTVLWALLIDATLQLVAGIIDWIGGNLRHLQSLAAVEKVAPMALDRSSVGRLIAAVLGLTVGNQIVQFSLAHLIPTIAPLRASLPPAILACCYLGAATAALFCGLWRIRWETSDASPSWLGSLVASRAAREVRFSFAAIIALSSLFLLASLGIATTTQWDSLWILGGIFVATFFLEFPLLALLERIGEWGNATRQKGIVSMTIGLMGFVGAIGLTFMLNFSRSIPGLMGVVVLCYVFIYVMLGDRRATRRPVPSTMPTSRWI